MTTPDTSWRAFFSAGGIALLIFVGGITLQAMEGFIGSAMLPTVVHDIGGLDYFAWNTTLFIVASIVATVFAAVRPERIGPRDASRDIVLKECAIEPERDAEVECSGIWSRIEATRPKRHAFTSRA